jgi:hypothetical protein
MSSLSIILTITLLSCFCNVVSADRYLGGYIGGGVGGLVIDINLEKLKLVYLSLLDFIHYRRNYYL